METSIIHCYTKIMNLKAVTSEESYLFFLVLLLVPLFFILQRTLSKKPPLPPGPFPWPLIGNIFQMGDGTQPLYAIFADLSKSYGPLISLKLGAQTAIIASSPAAAREILKTHDRFLSGRYVTEVTPIVYPFSLGFSCDCGEEWRYLRTICKTELFSTRAMEAQVGLREKKVMEMIEFLGTKEGEVVDLGGIVYASVTNMLTDALFSVDVLDFEGKGIGKELRDLITSVLGDLGLVPNISSVFPILRGLDVQGLKKRKKEILGKLVGVWEGIIEERRRQGIHSDPQRRDFLDTLIETGFNDGQINQLILELLLAGTDTSTIAVEWAMASLLKTQDAMDKLRDELRTKIGTPSEAIRDSHLAHLPYLQACVKETLRLHPPGPLLVPHRALETRHVMGYTVPKDSLIFVNVWAIGRDPYIWEEPLRFEPERFMGNGVDFKGKDFEYVPFGAGRRGCPGQPLAVREVPLIVASLVHCFDWCLPNGEDASELDMSGRFIMTMRKKVPLLLIPKVRNKTV